MIHYQQLQQLQVNISLNNPFIIERDTYEQFIEVDATATQIQSVDDPSP
jgi:hypothetical protein